MGSGQVFALAFLLLFVALKLTGVIAWSWVWVLLPLWLPISIVVVALILHAIMMAVSPKYRLRQALTDLSDALRRRP